MNDSGEIETTVSIDSPSWRIRSGKVYIVYGRSYRNNSSDEFKKPHGNETLCDLMKSFNTISEE